MTTDPRPTILPTRQKLAYSLGGFAVTLLVSAISLYLLKFYTDVAMVAPAVASGALLIGKLWDSVNDPLMGWLSDRTKSKLGRRRVYLLYGAVPLAGVTVLLFAVPAGLSPVWAFVVIALTYSLFDTVFTLVSVPFNALGAELTDDYDDRTSLMSVGAIGTVLGYLGGGVATGAVVQAFAGQPGAGYLAVGGVFGGLAGLSMAVVALVLRERPAPEASVSRPFVRSMWATLKDRPFRLALSAFALVRLAFTLLTTVLVFFLEYVLLNAFDQQRVLLVLFGCVACGVPFWRWAARKWEKGPAYAWGIGVTALGVAAMFVATPQQPVLVYATVAVIGLGMSAHWVVPWAMLPDVVDAGLGEDATGVYYGMYGVVDKIMRTVGLVVPGFVLQVAGYVPNQPQSDVSLVAIRALVALAPAVLLLCALPFLARYPLSRTALAQARAGSSATQPGR